MNLHQTRAEAASLLRSTFVHLPGIGSKTERMLWAAGIETWEDLIESRRSPVIRGTTREELEASIRAFAANEADWFANRLPRREHWRIALEYPSETLFVDIETTGLSRYYDSITVVGWSLDGMYDAIIAGENLDRFEFAAAKAKVLVTFNGSLFDRPFLTAAYPALRLPDAHVDLRFAARRLGLSGGQKAIEVGLGIARRRSLAHVDGRMAADLWRLYQRGSTRSLRLLLQYNAADVVGMERIWPRLAGGLMRACESPTRLRSMRQRRHVTPRMSSVAHRITQVDPWRGRVGPRLTYATAVQGTYRADSPILGIDLSGSEFRSTGWALIRGRAAIVGRVRTDAEIVRLAEEPRPYLVSIDAPLSLPHGRLRVDDDDPTRLEFGIMRECERILRRRGVNVYPALIRSMQALTERGIRLAAIFRERGIPVIESFPGAMQDILGIPRKRDGLEWLSRGLEEYGLVGSFSSGAISHDELDALSAAVVGQLALSGHIESLGNEEEGYLLVPDLRESDPPALVVGLSGATSSGKTTLAKGFESALGLNIVSTSRILAELAGHRNGASREKLQSLGSELRRSGKQAHLLNEVAARVATSRVAVVDSMRFPEDRAFLAERYQGGFVHVHVHADVAIRRERFFARGGTRREFSTAEASSVERAVPHLAGLADLVLVSNTIETWRFVDQSSAALLRHLESRGIGKCLSR